MSGSPALTLTSAFSPSHAERQRNFRRQGFDRHDWHRILVNGSHAEEEPADLASPIDLAEQGSVISMDNPMR